MLELILNGQMALVERLLGDKYHELIDEYIEEILIKGSKVRTEVVYFSAVSVKFDFISILFECKNKALICNYFSDENLFIYTRIEGAMELQDVFCMKTAELEKVKKCILETTKRLLK